MFLDVFPDLKIAEEFRELLKLVEVERVSTPRDRSSIRVYIASPRLIHKQQIVGLERGIKEQLFPNKKVSIRIFERYSCPASIRRRSCFRSTRTVFSMS